MGLVVNVDKIEKIYTHKAKQAKYVNYIKAKPEIKNFFGCIKQKKVEEYWYSWYSTAKYRTREDLINNSCEKGKYFINDEVLYEQSIWENPFIYIIMSNGDPITLYFDTYEELTQKVNDIIAQSKNNLMVIKD